MRCRSVNCKHDEGLVVPISVKPKAGIDVPDVLADISQPTKYDLNCFVRDLRVASEHFCRSEHSAVLGLYRTAQEQQHVTLLALLQHAAGRGIPIGQTTEKSVRVKDDAIRIRQAFLP